MPQFGTVKRVKPRLVVLRGFNPNEPHTRTSAVPVATGVVIKSGQVISQTWNGTLLQYEWVLGGQALKESYIALQDSVDPDVVEAGNLVGLSCSGQFELQTPFYKAGDTYNKDVYLTFDGVTGDVKVTALESGEAIIGRVSRVRGPKSLVGVDSSATTLDVIVFETMSLPNTADAVA